MGLSLREQVNEWHSRVEEADVFVAAVFVAVEEVSVPSNEEVHVSLVKPGTSGPSPKSARCTQTDKQTQTHRDTDTDKDTDTDTQGHRQRHRHRHGHTQRVF